MLFLSSINYFLMADNSLSQSYYRGKKKNLLKCYKICIRYTFIFKVIIFQMLKNRTLFHYVAGRGGGGGQIEYAYKILSSHETHYILDKHIIKYILHIFF